MASLLRSLRLNVSMARFIRRWLASNRMVTRNPSWLSVEAMSCASLRGLASRPVSYLALPMTSANRRSARAAIVAAKTISKAIKATDITRRQRQLIQSASACNSCGRFACCACCAILRHSTIVLLGTIRPLKRATAGTLLAGPSLTCFARKHTSLSPAFPVKRQ